MSEERTVFVSNLNEKVTKSLLEEIFTQVGPVAQVSLVPKKNFAFVEFCDEDSVLFCCRVMQELSLFNQSVSVRPRNNSEQDRRFRQMMSRRDPYDTPARSYNPREQRHERHERHPSSEHPRYQNFRTFHNSGYSEPRQNFDRPNWRSRDTPEHPRSGNGSSGVFSAFGRGGGRGGAPPGVRRGGRHSYPDPR